MPVLYDALIADWEFTADANDSTASGLNLTEQGGPLTYGAEGVTLNGIDQYLSHVDDPDLEIDADIMVMAEVVTTTLALKTIMGKGDPEEYELAIQGDGAAFMTVNDDLQNYTSAYTPAGSVVENTRSILFASFDIDTNTITIWNGDGTPNTEITNGGLVPNSGLFTIGCTTDGGSPSRLWSGTIRHARMWKGDISVPVAAIPWLNNSGAGRTYAEMADYTPTPGDPPDAPVLLDGYGVGDLIITDGYFSASGGVPGDDSVVILGPTGAPGHHKLLLEVVATLDFRLELQISVDDGANWHTAKSFASGANNEVVYPFRVEIDQNAPRLFRVVLTNLDANPLTYQADARGYFYSQH